MLHFTLTLNEQPHSHTIAIYNWQTHSQAGVGSSIIDKHTFKQGWAALSLTDTLSCWGGQLYLWQTHSQAGVGSSFIDRHILMQGGQLYHWQTHSQAGVGSSIIDRHTLMQGWAALSLADSLSCRGGQLYHWQTHSQAGVGSSIIDRHTHAGVGSSIIDRHTLKQGWAALAYLREREVTLLNSFVFIVFCWIFWRICVFWKVHAFL